MTHQEEAILFEVLDKNGIGKSEIYKILHDTKMAIYGKQCESEEPTISDLKEEARQSLFAAIDLLKLATEKYATEALNSCDLAWSANMKNVARLIKDINCKAYEIDEAFTYGEEREQEDEY